VSENKSVFNWTFCQLLTEKPNFTTYVLSNPLPSDIYGLKR